MERAISLKPSSWTTRTVDGATTRVHARLFVMLLGGCALGSAIFATWLPLQFSIVTLFLFAGPHNLMEFRYFLMRMPVRFGRSQNFFVLAFSGIFVLTVAYLSLPILFHAGLWSGQNWALVSGAWNMALLCWLAALIWTRGKQRRRDWSWAWPVAFALGSLNWLQPEIFSLALVYTHPLIALWFLDRQIRRTRPEWLPAYHRCLVALPLILVAICWQLAQAPALADDNGLAWRITQHAGAELLPNVSQHLLVSLHVFLETLHYLVWIVLLPLLTTRGKVWDLNSIPLVRHPRGFPRLILGAMFIGAFLVALLWFGFTLDYAATRDIYFALAISHVLAEAPFLLRTL